MKMTVSESDFQKKSNFALFAAYYRPNIKLFTIDMFCAFLIAGIDLCFPMMNSVWCKVADAHVRSFAVV